MRLGPARQGFRTAPGPKGSTSKEITLGAAGAPDLIFVLTTFLVSVSDLRMCTRGYRSPVACHSRFGLSATVRPTCKSPCAAGYPGRCLCHCHSRGYLPAERPQRDPG